MESGDIGEINPADSSKPLITTDDEKQLKTIERFQSISPDNSVIKVPGKDFNKIAQVEEAKKEFALRIKSLPPEEQAKAMKTFEDWYTGNFNPETGKITLYRFVDFDAIYPLGDVVENGIKPRGVTKLGDEETLLVYLEKSDTSWGKELADVFRRQKAGKDISDFAQSFSLSSGGGYPYDIATYWTTHGEFYSKTHEYRIAIELDPDEAWRADGGLDPNNFNPNDWIKGAELEWTVLGNIPKEKIKEIRHNPSGQNALSAPELFEMKGVKSIEELAEKVKKGNVDQNDISTALKSKDIVLNISEQNYLSTLDPKTLLSLAEIGASNIEIFSMPLYEIVNMLKSGMSKESIIEAFKKKTKSQ